jgi:isopenicillin N synthase-like dioxygenase
LNKLMPQWLQRRQNAQDLCMEYLNLPIVDFATLSQPDTLQALDSACRSWGAIRLVGHPLSERLQSDAHTAMTSFFHQPLEAKKLVERTADNPWGFYDHELTRQARDWKEIYDCGPAGEGAVEPQWPATIPGFQSAVSNFYEACEHICFEVLAAMAQNLGTPTAQMQNCFRPEHTSFVRLNYYPLCKKPTFPEGDTAASEGYLGINPHTDAGAITVLMQDEQAGLEIYRQKQWHTVAGGSLLVHLGDIMQVWSNDRYRAPLHRVRASRHIERFSAPFFFNPSYETQYQPLVSTVDDQHPPLYTAIQWGEFRKQRASGDYANYGEEIQISRFRTQSGSTRLTS